MGEWWEFGRELGKGEQQCSLSACKLIVKHAARERERELVSIVWMDDIAGGKEAAMEVEVRGREIKIE